MTEYFLMFFSVLLASLNSLILRKFKNRTFNTPGDSFFFNGGMSLIWTVIMTVWFFASGDPKISGGAVAFGAVYGVILCSFLYCKNQAIAQGPVSLTSLIGNCAFIPATWFGVVYAKESVNAFQMIGMCLMLVALFLCINPKKSGEKLSVKWFISCIAFFCAGGFIGMFYKVFGASDFSSEVNAMMLSASVFSCILFFAVGFLLNKVKKLEAPKIRKDSLLYVLLAGVTGCVYIRLNVSLSAVIPSAVFFPVANGGIVVITTLAGAFAFREKLNRIQILGILLGLVALIITGCGKAVFDIIF